MAASKSASPHVPKRVKAKYWRLHTYAPHVIHNSQQMEGTWGPTEGQLAGESTVYAVNETLVSLGTGGSFDKSYNIDEPPGAGH